MFDLKKQTAIVTGGGTGVGRATSLLLAELGCDVVVNYSRSESDAQATAQEVAALGRRSFAYKANVAAESEVQAMMKKAVDEFGRIDILVNNAAMTHMVPYTDLAAMTSERWDEIFDVNVKGAFHCCHHAMEALRKTQGQIVNVSSISGLTGQGSCIAYAASKAALINMTQALAISQAPDIRVNAVAPGVIETRWVKGWEKFTDPHKEATPLKRNAQPEDVARTIVGLITNPFLTGQTIVVDGGRTLV